MSIHERRFVLVRREFLVKAAVAGAASFVVPAIITVDPAGAAALQSPPPGKAQHVSVGEGSAELPRTGIGLDDLIVAGLAAAAGGGALLLWSADEAAT